mgnify:CR=1 FL=1
MKFDYDVVVVGGGTGGVLSALSAAKEGLRVAIVEKQSVSGGISTLSGLAEFNAQTYHGEEIYSGIEKEIFDELLRRNAARHYFDLPMSSNKAIKVDRLRYNPEILKLVLEDLLRKYEVSVYYDCQFISALHQDQSFEVCALYMGNDLVLNSPYVVDGTSNCELAKNLGCSTKAINTDKLLVSTLVFRISNVDVEVLQNVIDSGGLQPIIKEGVEKKILRGHILAFSPIPSSKDVSVNVTRTSIDHTEPAELSRGLSETRQQIEEVFDYIREKVPGLQTSYISNIAPILGVRDSVKIEGEYTLTLSDLRSLNSFDDCIATGCYPVDVHNPVTNKVDFIELNGVYQIPYRCCLPQKDINLAVVGKAISTDYESFAATRVMPIVMNVGESIGVLIAYAFKNRLNLHQLTVQEIREQLDQRQLVALK